MKKFKSDFLILLVLCILYYKYIPNWINEWTNFDSFYSFFPFLMIFIFQFFKIKAEEIHQTTINPSHWGLLPILTGLVIYFIGSKTEIDLLSGLSLPLLLSGIILFLYGKRIFVLVSPVIFFFTLSIPVLPMFRLTIPLQILLAEIVTKILHLLDISAYNIGSNIYINKYLVTIEAGCTGVKSLSSLLIVSFMLFYFKNISTIKKIFLTFLVFIISFLGNIARILLINFYIIYNGTKGAEAFHYNIGLIIFAVSLAIILILNEFIEDDPIATN